MSSETIEPSSDAPVNQLLSLGQSALAKDRDYTALGLSRQHIPALIRMATDEALNDGPPGSALVWAPVHAWRALGQFRAAEAVGPLLSLLHRIDKCDDDWVGAEIPEALGLIGAAALDPAADYLADAARGEWARTAAADTLGHIGRAHPDLRAECVAKLAAQLEKFSEQSQMLNAFLLLPLWDMRAVEAMPLIERAFGSGCVDESVLGDVEDVQIHFGLKTKREPAPKPSRLTDFSRGLGDVEDELQPLDQEEDEMAGIGDEPDFAPLPELYGPDQPHVAPQPYIAPPKIGRNEPCPCGSGKKYKKCCGA